MRITDKGQVTIPREIRRKVGLLPGVEVDFEVQGRKVVMVARNDPMELSKREAEIRDHLVQTRGRAGAGWTTEDVMRLTRGDD